MQLTQAQINLIKSNWRSLRGIEPTLIADIFYTKLFADHPRLRKLFPADLQLQYVKLMDMLNSIVSHLDYIQDMSGEIVAMGKRHIDYGVKPEQYKMVGEALLWTLQKGMGKDWTEESAKAWGTCYTILANMMTKSS